MLKVFGRKDCPTCREKLEELESSKKEFEYYDLDTAEGLAVAAIYDLLSEPRDLPILIEDDKILE